MTLVNDLPLERLVLSYGQHDWSGNGLVDGQLGCVMEWTSYLAGEPWSDHPKCVSTVVGDFCRSWNDALNDDDRQMLRPYAAKVIGTNTGTNDDRVRSYMALDWLARVHAPAWLALAGLDEHAGILRALSTLSDARACKKAQPKLAAAWDAAGDAARDAAWAAAGAAAGAAAWDAAGAAAGAAARDAAGAAARDAARAAAWAAAWAAARAAAWNALRPTVVTLQASALDLLDRMIEVGK